MMEVKWVMPNDLPVVAEMMHHALDSYYGGNHQAHASTRRSVLRKPAL